MMMKTPMNTISSSPAASFARRCGITLFVSVALISIYAYNFSRRQNLPPSLIIDTSSSSSSHILTKFAAVDNDRVLNVHVVPHTHDDVGWLKTVEQYFNGWNHSIDTRGNVRSILSTTIHALLENDARTFVIVEMKFFKMWWEEQSDAVKDSVRYLVASKQLSFVNGGHCMHDEASTHYISMIDQTTLGHEFLLRELGFVPTIGWQLDPFGHSATQASLLTARAGFDALYFGRIDYQDMQLRHLTKECEGLWNATSNMDDATVFWGLTGSYEGNYGPPQGFWFDVLTPDNEPLVGANESRQIERIHTFLEDLKIQGDRTKGNHIMLTMGSDFHFMEAHYNFQNYDLLVSLIMAHQQWGNLDIPAIFGPQYDRVNLFYSSPEYYTEQKHRQSTPSTGSLSKPIEWSIKMDDFFPYSDCPHCFWTGYFTSRAAFKRFERAASSFLMAARQIESKIAPMHSNQTITTDQLFALEDALGVVQHHDAVSGTAKQHVADDYSKGLQDGLDKAARFVVERLKAIMLEDPQNDIGDLSFCQRLNESVCEVSESATKLDDRALTVIVYNPMSAQQSTIVRLPVAWPGEYVIERMDNGNGPLVTLPARDPRKHLSGQEKNILAFDTGPMPPAGATFFRITRQKTRVADKDHVAHQDIVSTQRSLNEALVVSNGLLTVKFNQHTGMVDHVSANGIDLNVTQTWGYYKSFDSSVDNTEVPYSIGGQNSGAYIFRPSVPDAEIVPLNPAKGKATVIETSVGTEVHAEFEQGWVHQVTRVYKGQPFVEIEYTVGPIPIDDGRGKEIVTRWQTPIRSSDTFYTDSNGREFQKRRRNYRPSWSLETYEPVAGNYYPVNAAIYIEDKDASLAVVTDRSQGGASLSSGSIELLVQRRTIVDDGRGVDEPLNETSGGMTPYPPFGDATRIGSGVIIRGTHRLLIGKGNGGAGLSRLAMDGAFAQPLVFVGSSSVNEETPFREESFSILANALPPNVMLITFARLRRAVSQQSHVFLLRLAHQYAIGEDTNLSQPATVDLSSIFADYKVEHMTEKTLTANQDWESYLDRKLKWTSDRPPAPRAIVDPSSLCITLQPMDIRTFQIVLQEKKSSLDR